MKLVVRRFEELHGTTQHETPDHKAAMLGHAASDYLTILTLLHENREFVWLLMSFELPTMHQCLELVVKAIVFKVDPNFAPKKFSHKTLDIVRAYASKVPIFASSLADADVVSLFEGLEKSYLTLRYGEGGYDAEDVWDVFCKTADGFLDVLRDLTGLRFPVGLLEPTCNSSPVELMSTVVVSNF